MKLLKMYNKRDPKELLSLRTSDIRGKTYQPKNTTFFLIRPSNDLGAQPKKCTFTRADDYEKKYLMSGINPNGEPEPLRNM